MNFTKQTTNQTTTMKPLLLTEKQFHSSLNHLKSPFDDEITLDFSAELKKCPSHTTLTHLYTLFVVIPKTDLATKLTFWLIREITTPDTAWEIFLSLATKKVDVKKLSLHQITSKWKKMLYRYSNAFKILELMNFLDEALDGPNNK